ncbi:MAG: acyl-CoA dehydrogenase family protein, partial [Solirubrobacteraceae bacterium]
MSATVSPSSDTTAALNQPPPMPDHNAFAAHAALREALHREGGGWAEDRLLALGELAGNQQIRDLGRLANENPPVLRTFDRYGHRIDEVEFHPAWHELLEHATAHGLHALPWAEPQDGAHAARAAMFMTWNVEAGHGCPISMTYSAVPALRKDPELAAEWEPKMAVYRYDKRFVPAAEKESVLFGMAMTEKQGGSDVRANTTRAAAIGDGEYEIFGHKWFCSAPMCDAFLILAQADGGLTCFVLPRWKPDGSRNAFRLQRLKDKLGNRSNASSEVEFHGAYARRLGEEGRGVPTIIEMVGHTRLDCVIGAAAGMRVAVEQASWQVDHRSAFGKLLATQPLMRNVLADLALESEAATVTAMRLARS